jgi:hypothetical protein
MLRRCISRRPFIRSFSSIVPIPTIMDLRVPKELKRVETRSTTAGIVPGELWRHFADQLNTCEGDPGKILKIANQYMKSTDDLDTRFIVRALYELGSSFDFNSFWATGDRQVLKDNMGFKNLIADLIEQADQIAPSDVPAVLYALACLEYRPRRLVDKLLPVVETHMDSWRFEVLSNLGFSIAVLGGNANVVEKIFARIQESDAGDLHAWSQLAFAAVLAGESNYGFVAHCLARACACVKTQSHLDRSGWAQFFIYQSLYAADVERPIELESVRSAIPEWIQQRIHFRWVDGGILTNCQPQGVDSFQMDVDRVLRRTNTQALVNCSVSRESDEKPCWFAGHKLNPKIALEYNSMLDTELSGWHALKTRIMRKMGYTVAVIHRKQWSGLSDTQKDEQILLLRAQLGYVHDGSKQAKPTSRPTKTLSPETPKWEDQPDWQPHLREPELELTVHGYRPKDTPNFKGGVRVNFRRKHIANGNHNWVNSLAPKG